MAKVFKVAQVLSGTLPEADGFARHCSTCGKRADILLVSAGHSGHLLSSRRPCAANKFVYAVDTTLDTTAFPVLWHSLLVSVLLSCVVLRWWLLCRSHGVVLEPVAKVGNRPPDDRVVYRRPSTGVRLLRWRMDVPSIENLKADGFVAAGGYGWKCDV